MSAKGMPNMSLKGMLVNAAASEMGKRMSNMGMKDKNKINPVQQQRLPDVKKMQDNLKVKAVKQPKGSKP